VTSSFAGDAGLICYPGGFGFRLPDFCGCQRVLFDRINQEAWTAPQLDRPKDTLS